MWVYNTVGSIGVREMWVSSGVGDKGVYMLVYN